MNADFRLALRLLWREARSGELRLLFLAVTIAVASLTCVGFFTDRVRQALESEATQLLGADLLLIADHPWSPAIIDRARRSGLRTAQTQTFPSMVMAGERAQLAEIKAVSAGYPLRGRLRIATGLNRPDAPAEVVPAPGTIWVDERLASSLALVPGGVLKIGASRLAVAAILTLEPDRGINFFGVAPRLLMNLDDLAATGLIQVGSRVGYRLLVAGEPAAVEAFRREIAPGLGRGERIEDTRGARPEIRNALDRGQRFLGLSALLAVVLSAVGVALAARRYVQRHLDPFAVMRCLGATQARLLRLSLIQFVSLAAVSSIVGALLGYAAHFVLHAWLASLMASALPPPSLLPAIQGLVVGLVLVLAFALPPLMQLRRVPTVRVIRRELGAPELGAVGAYGLGAAALVGLMFWLAREPKLGAWVAGGFVVATLVFSLIAWAFVRLLGRLGSGGRVGWRRGLSGLARRPLAATIQIVALALGFMALILLTVTRGELIDAWQRAIPHDAPNRFVIGIQPEQVAEVASYLAAAGSPARLDPMVRGRLVAIGGRPIGAADYEDDRARRLIDREFNLSWRDDLPEANRQVAGRWFSAADQGQGVASVEEGLAKTLRIEVGDELTWSIAGESLRTRVVGLRKLNWDSMRVNFFVLFPSGVIEAFPASYITSFHLPETRQQVVDRLVERFPNLTVVDVATILRQMQNVTDQVSRAVQFIFLFTLAAGLVVLYAALLAAFDERRYELAVMRALGARHRQLRAALMAEFAAIGGLAGVIAAAGALAVAGVLATKVFEIDLVPDFWLLPVAMLTGAALVSLAGGLATYRLLSLPAIEVLRAE